ncbi:sporulation integral membrane protein YtvI [Aneurinibacillus aneurinilyticus]|jgi:sporulation integral membrane protein YtvI|uniref:Sporulation integral membrane protein YtvI n=1 Tax=Aneurinibacillus aneurinilyticus TaxID=1391 RepID=A0A848CU07_ANEAE|nr:sporulation integral membrane protein YtvI [Aneurinibacillus aneurinilyticus]MCI1693521.1 sporulation integral membrane protein YtvI [Aneurinibacillus aneurinilyticus]NME99085.1 sporulation integral membrane protein YtvI [Aneurinibacillus aneurinilyticus]
MNTTLFYHRLFQVLRFLLVIGVIYIAYKLTFFLTPLLYPFIIGFIIAYLIKRPVDLLEHRGRWPRWLAVTSVLTIVILVILGITTILVAQVIIEIGKLLEMLPIYIDQLSNYARNSISHSLQSSLYDHFMNLYSNLDASYKEKIQQNVGQAMTKIAQAGTNITKTFLGGISNLLSSIPNTATVLVISVLSAFFISKDYHKITHKTKSMLPGDLITRSTRVTGDLRKALVGFIKAQFTLISITAVIVIIGLFIIGVPYAVSIGLLTGLVDLLPYLGTGTVFVPWIAYAFFDGDIRLAVGLGILYAIVIVQRQVMEPKIVADNVGLDPLLTLIALFVGLKLFGFLGLILGPVLLVVINALQGAGVFRDIWLFIKGTPPA